MISITLAAIFFFSLASSAETLKLNHKAISTGTAVSTGYNSLPEQTDSTPWITAAGTRCHWGVVAANFLPLGTQLKIDGFDNQIFVVEDRTAARFGRRIDIWFPEYDQAIEHGKREVKYYVVAVASS